MNKAGVSSNPKGNGPPRRKVLLTIVRVLAFIFMLFCVGLFIVGTYEYKQYATSHLKEIAPYSWTAQEFEHFLGRIKWSLSDWIQLNQAVAIIVALIFCGVGFLIIFRKGHDWFGLYIATIFALYGSLSGTAWTGFTGAHPDWDWLLIPLGTYPWFALFSLFYLFPDGHFVPRWVRWPFLLLILFFNRDLYISRESTSAWMGGSSIWFDCHWDRQSGLSIPQGFECTPTPADKVDLIFVWLYL